MTQPGRAERAKEETAQQKERERRQRAVAKAQSALDAARRKHEKNATGTGLSAALLRGTPSAIRDDRFTRCPFPAATTHAPMALARSSNTAMEHQNRCTDLRHPEVLAACCPYSSVHGKLVVQHPSRTKKVGKLPPLRSFSFLTLRDKRTWLGCERRESRRPLRGRAILRRPHRRVFDVIARLSGSCFQRQKASRESHLMALVIHCEYLPVARTPQNFLISGRSTSRCGSLG